MACLLYNDTIYSGWLEDKASPDHAWLLKSSVETPSWDTLFKLSKDSTGYYVEINQVHQAIINGIDALIFQNTGYNFQKLNGRKSIYAIKRSSGNIIWKALNID